jgi:hypothetical protein
MAATGDKPRVKARLIASYTLKVFSTLLSAFALQFRDLVLYKVCPNVNFCTSYLPISTSRKGIRYAKSSIAWKRPRIEGYVKFNHRFRTEGFLQDTKPADIDEFGGIMRIVTFGPERVDNWENSSIP